VGPAVLKRALNDRMRALGIKHENEYALRVTQSAPEMQALIEAVVVPETWFFRYPESFAALADMVRKDWLPTHPIGVLRVLSVPCSTGEEPYSIVMALLDAGLPASRLQVDAIDISQRALAVAQRAQYRPNSFRNEDATFRDRYFHAVPVGHQLAEPVRERVNFRLGNILNLSSQMALATYDAIFCRNGLIYFDAETQQAIIRVLTSLLTPTGMLFVGSAEAMLLQGHGLTSAGYPRTFAYRKTDAAAVTTQPPLWRSATKASPSPAPSPTRPTKRKLGEPLSIGTNPLVSKPVRAPEAHKTGLSGETTAHLPCDLETATRLADQGQLEKAIVLCETYIKQKQPSAEAYYLLGVLHDALHHPEAADCYQKVIYLQPNHTEALSHMALLLQKKGDTERARQLNLRVRRIEERAGR
jgi:chemotaxis protein methyltransferase WspC